MKLIHGDALTALREMGGESVHCCVTSPPYWGLRDYGVAGQLGLERTPEEYIARMVEVFREVRRVLRADGTCWINIGDSYMTSGGTGANKSEIRYGRSYQQANYHGVPVGVIRAKNLIGIPWMLAFALRADGWYLRSEIIWAKCNPMPESVQDRPTKAHEQIFLLSKSERYFYDADAIREPVTGNAHARGNGVNPKCALPGSGIKQNSSFSGAVNELVYERNKRSVWTVATQPTPEAHFATYPIALIEPCILAGCPAGGVVLDPFAGAGTTSLAALKHGRDFLGIELNADYIAIAEKRLQERMPLLAQHDTITPNAIPSAAPRLVASTDPTR